MIDDVLYRRVFDAEHQVHAAHARETVAASTRDHLREDVRRLETEVSIGCAIASELFSTLLDAAPERAGHAFASVVSHYGRYRDNPEFANLSDLLDRFERARRASACDRRR